MEESVVRGEDLFGTDSALHAVVYLNGLAKLESLETDEETKSRMETGVGTYSMLKQACASAAAAERVRQHLDDGVLHKICKKQVANFFNPLSLGDYTAHGAIPVLLGACAMSHGYHTLKDAPGYHMFFANYMDFLRGIFEPAMITDGAKSQMKKALYGQHAFKSGTPIDFTFTAFDRSNPPSNIKPFLDGKPQPMTGLIPKGYKSQRKADTDGALNMIGPCSKSDMGYGPDSECGGCKNKLNVNLMCSKCKDQKYCSKECQRSDFRRHKGVCRTPRDRELMFAEEDGFGAWTNIFYVKIGSGMGGMAGLAQILGGMGMGVNHPAQA